MLENKNNILSLILNGNKKKVIGRIEGSNLFMVRSMDKHFYRVLNAWCINIEVANEPSIEQIIIKLNDGTEYHIFTKKIKALRSKVNMFISHAEGERQLAIPLQCWDKYSKDKLMFPSYIGIPADEFVDVCAGRWRGRLIAYSQKEINI